MKGQKNIFNAYGDQKKERVAILISDKINIEIKTVIRNKEGHLIMIKGTIQEKRYRNFKYICTQHSEVKSLSCVCLFATLWTVVYQAPPSTGSSRQEYWSDLPFPSPGDPPNPGIKPASPALKADALLFEPRVCKANASKYEREINSNTVIVGGFKTPLMWTDQQNRKLAKKHKF